MTSSLLMDSQASETKLGHGSRRFQIRCQGIKALEILYWTMLSRLRSGVVFGAQPPMSLCIHSLLPTMSCCQQFIHIRYYLKANLEGVEQSLGLQSRQAMSSTP